MDQAGGGGYGDVGYGRHAVCSPIGCKKVQMTRHRVQAGGFGRVARLRAAVKSVFQTRVLPSNKI
ncbi:hypothetical protein BN2497_6953 [Janthinobacterium sp. CG23_2]|nr:hypothetical protein BN2497_6953 [Janthinobacterium sp. CG23_2]CUU29874.1 hypothetical protein BN3177_6953 [Janthinobacterium sp. CG23_2]